MNISALLYSYHDKSGEQNSNMNLFVARAIASVIQDYFLKWAPSFVLTICCRNKHTCNFYNDMLEKLFSIWGTPFVQIVNIPRNFKGKVPGRRHFNVILTDSYQAFLEIDVISYTAEYNYNEFYYIFLQARDQLLPVEIQRILEYCWTHYIIHCNVQIQQSNGEVLVYTYFPFSAQHCGEVLPVLVNRFVGDAFEHEQLFPRKVRNLHGCVLRAALWHVPPHIYLETDRNGISRIVGGFEGVLLQELARKFNFTIEVIVPPNDEQRGRIKANNTVNGALGMLRNRIADLSVGSFRQSTERTRVASSTISYYQTAQVFCILRSAYAFSSGEILLFPFQRRVWLSFLILGLLSLIVVGLVNHFHHKFSHLFPNYRTTHTYLNVLLMAIGNPATTMPQRNHARLHCANFMISSLVIRTIYLALLFHFIRTHLTHPLPQTVDDLLAKNYTVVLNRATYDSVIVAPFIGRMKSYIINSTVDTIAFDYIERMRGKQLVGAAPLDFLLHYGLTNKKGGIFKILPVHIFSQPLTMYMTKHSFLIDQFDEDITWMRGVGLIDAWSGWELNYEYFKTENNTKRGVFGFEELYMIFVLGGYGLGGSVIVFVLELLVGYIHL